MTYIFQRASVFQDNVFSPCEAISVCVGDFPKKTVSVSHHCFILPGFIDVHVHFREPGFSYKETIGKGSLAAAAGGYTAVLPMPNLSPVPDSAAHLEEEWQIIRRDARVAVLPYGSITVGEKGDTLSDMAGMAKSAIAFSDDGVGVANAEIMREAMLRAKALGKIIVAHCEDKTLARGGYIHDGVYARKHNHKGISSESEWMPIKRDLMLAQQTGCAYHICHVSTKESVALIREAKRRGVDVTCETAPHYLVLTENDLQEDGRFKMNPPLRGEADRKALLGGILDGTIDMIATDHAPHSAEEKSWGLMGSAMGIVGLETAFPVLYTKLVKTGMLTMEKLIKLMVTNPAKRFGIQQNRQENFTVFDTEQKFTIDPRHFQSKGRATPFAGWEVFGKCILTVAGGKAVWQEAMTEN